MANNTVISTAGIQAGMADDFTWGPQLLGYFDFTLAFEQIVLSIIPTVPFIVCTPYYLIKALTQEKAVHLAVLGWIKLFFGIAFLTVSIVFTTLWARTPAIDSPLALAANVLSSFLAVCTLIAVYVEHCYSLRPARSLSVYLSLSLILDICKTRSYVLRDLRDVAGLSAAIGLCKLILVILEEISKRNLLVEAPTTPIGREATAGFWNWSLFIWLNHTFILGYRSIIGIDDLDFLDNGLKPHFLRPRFEAHWAKANKTAKYALLWTFLRTVGPGHLFVGVLARWLQAAFMFVQPFIISRVVAMVVQPEIPKPYSDGIIWATAVSYFCTAISRAVFRQAMARNSTMMRACYSSAIFTKMFRLQQSALEKSSAVTLLTNDITGCQRFVSQLNEFVACIACIIVGIVYLVFYVGAASFLAVVPIIVTSVISYFCALRMKEAKKRWNEAAELRVGVTTNMLHSIKSVRISGLTQVFETCITKLMLAEIEASKKNRTYQSFLFGIEMVANAITPIIILAGGMFWTKRQEGMSNSEIYATLSVAVLIADPLTSVIHSLSFLGTQLACTERIQQYLTNTDDEVVDIREDPATAAPISTQPTKGSGPRAAFSPESSGIAHIIEVATSPVTGGRQILQDCNVTFPKDKTTMIVGPVGGGKSTLLGLLTGETQTVRGRIIINPDEVSHCGQTPWLENTTIRNNILGNLPFNQTKYTRVINACCLEEDIAAWPLRDEMVAGSGGCNLSGGQKQRVLLARCLYRSSNILILDDVFSGLDRDTATIITSRLFGEGGLLSESSTTVIMATNLVEHLQYADQLVHVNENGLIAKVDDIAQYAKRTYLQHTSELASDAEPTPQNKAGDSDDTVTEKEEQTDPQAVATPCGNLSVDEEKQNDLTDEKLLQRQRGNPDAHRHYLDSFGWVILSIWFAGTALSELLMKMPNIYLRIWLDREPGNRLFFIGYALFGLAGMTASTLSVLYFFLRMVPKSYAKLHSDVLKTTLHSSTYFLSTTDMGSLINRFSQDMVMICQDLAFSYLYSTELFFMVVVDIGIILSGASYAASLLPFFIMFLALVQRYYLRTSRQMRLLRIEAASPVLGVLMDVASGIQRIRTHGEISIFQSRFEDHLDYALRPFYQAYTIQQWLYMALDMGVLCMALLVVSLAVKVTTQTSPNGIGLAMVNLVALSQNITYLFTYSSETEIALGAVSRVKDFEEQTPKEAGAVAVEDPGASLLWPDAGSIEIRNMSARHNPTSRASAKILNGVDLDIPSGAKVGIVGRTGSGKTALMMCLTNMMERDGNVYIDGIELRSVPNELLRSKLTCIPQDAVEIPGSIRFNLYPYEDRGLVQDATMIEVLGRLDIWEYIKARGGLDADAKIIPLSPGQRQILCIARGIMHHLQKKTKIILMDEVTSKMDYGTDKKVQGVVLDYFKDCTTLTIAHRQETLRHVDIIVRMSKGKAHAYMTGKDPRQEGDDDDEKASAPAGEPSTRRPRRVRRSTASKRSSSKSSNSSTSSA